MTESAGDTTKRGVWAALTRSRKPPEPTRQPGAPPTQGTTPLFRNLFGDAPAPIPDAHRFAGPAKPGTPADAATRATELDATLFGWAMREVSPWRMQPVSRAETARVLAHLNATHDWATLYRFADGDATEIAKPDAVIRSDSLAYRTAKYLAFFKQVARLLPPGFTTTVCMGMHDRVNEHAKVPLFCFQKNRRATTLLLPDLNFLEHDFYEASAFADSLPYGEKRANAVFAGATTGDLIDTEMARTLTLPRLRAAGYFLGNKRVDFRLPHIVQCTTPEAEALLRAQPFTQKPLLSTEEQFASRFMLSMDGNGATCSRVVVALNSRCVLMKYESDDVLYYFGGLQSWVHYVPIRADREVEKILDMEARDPAIFQRIGETGRAFAQTYLVRPAVQRYAAMLLQAYEASFVD